jgi:hypothetical protein
MYATDANWSSSCPFADLSFFLQVRGSSDNGFVLTPKALWHIAHQFNVLVPTHVHRRGRHSIFDAGIGPVLDPRPLEA